MPQSVWSFSSADVREAGFAPASRWRTGTLNYRSAFRRSSLSGAPEHLPPSVWRVLRITERIQESNRTKDADCFASDESNEPTKWRNREQPDGEQKITDMLCAAETTIAPAKESIYALEPL